MNDALLPAAPGLLAARGPVLVIGSANVDVSVSTPVLPRPGETVAGTGSIISVGGKGANQAVAAAACGAATRIVGRVGDDAFGRMVQEQLAGHGVEVAELRMLEAADTGLAAIYVDESGQNCIVVVPGANAALAPTDIDRLEPLIRAAAIVVLQCEVPIETVYRAIALAAACGTPVILNPAPYRGLELGRLRHAVTYLVPNETEAAEISGAPVTNPAAASACAAALQKGGIECVIVTLGAQGCVVADAAGTRHLPAHRVRPLDTTGAGDAFVGCLAASLATGHPRDESIRRAIVYAALSTMGRGAQVSYPSRERFESVLGTLARPAGA